MPKISIIVPVFGVEKYIEKCARSLFEQSLDDIEYIFVNDCTKDESINILKEVMTDYPRRSHQVSILHHNTNQGLPIARQTGIKHASGEYILHCDSDDWIETDACELLYAEAKTSDADIVISDYYRVKGGDTYKCSACNPNMNKEQIVYNMYFQYVPYMVWNKLVRRSLYDKIEEYPVHTHGEDFALILQLSYFADVITYLPKAFYYYRLASDTAYHVENEENRVKKFYAAVENARLIERFLSGKNVNHHIENGLMWLKNCQRGKLIPLLNQDKYYRLWKSTFSEINLKLFFNTDLRFKHKIKYFLVYFRLLTFQEK